jgi:hypothetical protein
VSASCPVGPSVDSHNALGLLFDNSIFSNQPIQHQKSVLAGLAEVGNINYIRIHVFACIFGILVYTGGQQCCYVLQSLYDMLIT